MQNSKTITSQQTSHVHLSHDVSGRYLKIHGEGPDVAEDLGALREEHRGSGDARTTVVDRPPVSGH